MGMVIPITLNITCKKPITWQSLCTMSRAQTKQIKEIEKKQCAWPQQNKETKKNVQGPDKTKKQNKKKCAGPRQNKETKQKTKKMCRVQAKQRNKTTKKMCKAQAKQRNKRKTKKCKAQAKQRNKRKTKK